MSMIPKLGSLIPNFDITVSITICESFVKIWKVGFGNIKLWKLCVQNECQCSHTLTCEVCSPPTPHVCVAMGSEGGLVLVFNGWTVD